MAMTFEDEEVVVVCSVRKASQSTWKKVGKCFRYMNFAVHADDSNNAIRAAEVSEACNKTDYRGIVVAVSEQQRVKEKEHVSLQLFCHIGSHVNAVDDVRRFMERLGPIENVGSSLPKLEADIVNERPVQQ